MHAALFDLDGVIIDSEGLYSQFWAEIGRYYGVPSPTFAADIKGSTLVNILATYFPDEATSAEVRRRIDDYERTMQYRLFPGVIEFLTALRSEGIKTAIVTSSDDKKMGHLFAQHPELRTAVDTIIDASMVTRSKPDPQGYLLAAEKLCAAPADCFVFEDSLQGLEAGRRAGATVIGLATTNPASIIQPLCDYLLPSFEGFTPTLMLSLSK